MHAKFACAGSGQIRNKLTLGFSRQISKCRSRLGYLTISVELATVTHWFILLFFIRKLRIWFGIRIFSCVCQTFNFSPQFVGALKTFINNHCRLSVPYFFKRFFLVWTSFKLGNFLLEYIRYYWKGDDYDYKDFQKILKQLFSMDIFQGILRIDTYYLFNISPSKNVLKFFEDPKMKR